MITQQPAGTARPRTRAGFAVVCVALLGAAACSSGKSNGNPSAAAVTTTTQPRPAGPAADMSTQLTGGQGVFMGEIQAPDLRRAGYVQREYAAAGTAASYK